jgi:hypothetical protein
VTKQPVLTLSLLAVLTARAGAITAVPMTFEQLVGEATAVVYARVADVRGEWTHDRRAINSMITLEALRYLKGDLGPTVLMRLPGGEAGGMINVLPGAPVLREGELVVLFLTTQGPSIPTTVGLGQGVFRVVRDVGSGSMLVSPPSFRASEIGRIVRGSAERRLLTLEAFAATVHAIGAG